MLPSTDTHEMISLPLGIDRRSVNFAVRVEDNSMSPLLCDSDILLVKAKHKIRHGELGVLLLDGSMHVKRCYLSGKQCRLESLDVTVPDIVVDDYTMLDYIGEVVKILHPDECRVAEI